MHFVNATLVKGTAFCIYQCHLYYTYIIMFGSYSKDVALELSNLKQELNRLKNVRELSQNSVGPNTEGKTLESPLTELPIYIELTKEYINFMFNKWL